LNLLRTGLVVAVLAAAALALRPVSGYPENKRRTSSEGRPAQK